MGALAEPKAARVGSTDGKGSTGADIESTDGAERVGTNVEPTIVAGGVGADVGSTTGAGNAEPCPDVVPQAESILI